MQKNSSYSCLLCNLPFLCDDALKLDLKRKRKKKEVVEEEEVVLIFALVEVGDRNRVFKR